MRPIPVMRPRLPSPAAVMPRLEEVAENGWYTNLGPLVRDLEARFASRLGVSPSQVVTASSGTTAIQGAVATSTAPGWLVPDYTFAATGLAVRNAGLPIALADVELATGVIDPTALSDLPSWGLVVVTPFGSGLSLDAWREHEHVIIDAAASLGSMPNLEALPNAWAVAFSLHATKVAPAGEGGFVVFGDAERARSFRAWTNFGFRGSRSSTLVGTNAKMSEIHAAYAHASLDEWELERTEWLAAQSLARVASRGHTFSDTELAQPYWIAKFRDATTRDAVQCDLSAAAIQTRQWWPVPLHEMDAFADIPLLGNGEAARELAQTSLGLPMFRGLATEHVEIVAAVLAEVPEEARVYA